MTARVAMQKKSQLKMQTNNKKILLFRTSTFKAKYLCFSIPNYYKSQKESKLITVLCLCQYFMIRNTHSM